MKEYSVFDILGPIMIGPSSSHTAGAAKLGKIARAIAGNNFDKVVFKLHGSFAKTYKGHGTDKALVAGVLNLEPHDSRLKNSIQIAEKNNLKIEFIESDLGDVHTNSVKIEFYCDEVMNSTVTGSSIGGGNIMIINIDGYSVDFSGDYSTMFIRMQDTKGMIHSVTTALALRDLNIATMKVSRKQKGNEASMIIEVDGFIDEDLVNEVMEINNIFHVQAINPSKEEIDYV